MTRSKPSFWTSARDVLFLRIPRPILWVLGGGGLFLTIVLVLGLTPTWSIISGWYQLC